VKIFFTSKFRCVLFCNPTHKTEIGRANRWGTTNNTPLGQMIMMGQSETLSSSLIIFTTLFYAGLRAKAMHAIMQSQNYFPEPNQQNLDLFHPILLCRITYLTYLQFSIIKWAKQRPGQKTQLTLSLIKQFRSNRLTLH
jgi:hypothetical protein